MKRLLATLSCSIVFAVPPAIPKAITLTGRLIAIHWAQFPMNGNVYPAILIQLEPTADGPSMAIQIHGAVPEAEYSKWQKALPALKQFCSNQVFVITRRTSPPTAPPGLGSVKPGVRPIRIPPESII